MPRDVRDDVLGIFDAHAPAVHRYVRSCGIASDVADDIVQEAFVALFQHLRKGGRAENLAGWVMQVGYRLALKHRRTEWRKRRWQGAWNAEAATVPDPAAGPEDACVARDSQRRLRAVLKVLPERDRQCVYLRAEGLRYREIADVLGVSLGAVAKSLTRAVSRLTAAAEK
jgi:RNA polymerase sigma-70 factor, ECF subfamily